MRRWIRISLGVSALLGLAAPASARSIWLPPAHGNEIRLTALHPAFDHGDVSALSMLWTASLDNQVAPGRYFLCEIPVAHFDGDSLEESSTTIGNPYFGWRAQDPLSRWQGEFGFRLPVASEDEFATVLAMFSEQVDEFEAWWPKVLSIRALATYVSDTPRSPGARIGFGPVVWIYTDDDYEDEFEVWIRYYGQALFPTEGVVIGAGLSGRYLVSEDNEGVGFDARSVHEFSVFAGRRAGVWRPAVRMRFPWDDELSEYQDPAFEVSLGRGF